ncbi:MAG: GAF domain-containing sensor histidine kinase [Chloroflexi bacterium]|nr:GAF domain-containing sensor histidine kinase [Chloroflexota bacterium]
MLATQREIAGQDFNLNASLDLVTSRAHELSLADGASIELVENDELTLKTATGLLVPYLYSKYKFAQGISGQCYLNNKAYYCEDAETDERVDRTLCRQVDIRSVLVVPLVWSSKVVWGVLKVVSRQANAFSQEDVQFLQIMAGIAAMVLCQDRQIHTKRALVSELAQHTKLQEELLQNLTKEKELRLNTSQFISLISHDFRTPLTAIQSSTELLQYYSERFSAEKKAEIYERVHSSVRHLTEMLDNIALIGKARVDKIVFQPEPISPGDLCKSLLSEFEPSTSPQHRLVYTGPADNKFLMLDKNLLRLVLWHLLNNALKYSPEDLPVELDLTIQPEAIVFSVKDQGIGIPPQEQSRIYEIFFRASNVANVRGSGMGLTIVRHCLELHGGSISFTSEVGQGTTFTISIPLPTGKF